MADSDSAQAGPAADDSPPASAKLPTFEQAYRNLLEDNVDPVVITDLDGVVIDANLPAVRFARLAKKAELIGEALNSERVSPALRSLNTSLPAARQNDSLHQTIDVRQDGRDFCLDLHTRHVARDGREAIQWLIHDRTEQQELERARDEQIYMIVHDLRNPLGNVISSLELLRDSLNDPNMTPAPGALLNIALRSSRRISLLVESLMDMTRMEAGQFTLTTTTARLDTLIEHAVDFVKPTADRKRIPLTVQLEAGLPPVLIDVNMIERVIVNLLDNACKFVLPGQAVAVGARRGQANEVEIYVRDEGPGIPPEDRARLFQKFSRGYSVSGHTPGTGLGLAFCKLAVVTHGGRISVDSEVGKGSTFTFSLPAETT
jgi:PAS domain S-box-containing protein